MRFYNRESELALLKKVEEMSLTSAQMTFVVGRRRIGKTRLLLKAFEGSDFIYLFVAKKNEALLCSEFVEEIRQKLDIPVYGEVKSMKDVFAILIQASTSRSFTVIFDEFQEFMTVRSSIYADIQHLWDKHKEDSKINLILCGSVFSMMSRIFENTKEPLFGRATKRLHLKPFGADALKAILKDQAPDYTPEDLLAFYMITGGVAKYVELLVQEMAFSRDAIIDVVFTEDSMFLDEGRNVLIEEFGKEYGNYFSILSLIASGKTSRVEIESIMEMQVGGFLDRLEMEYNLIKKVRPILAKPGSRSVKYKINDRFLSFWFRFIYKYRSSVEAKNMDYLREIVRRDYATFSGSILEEYFIEKIQDEKKYNSIGTYWERKNNHEIDIVAINELEKKVLIAEVKRQKKKIDISNLELKSTKIRNQLPGYKVTYAAFSMEDM